MTFEELGLSPAILQAIERMGYTEPTPVQAEVIPRLLANRGDLVALAQTGTGKTAAFGLPILTMLDHAKRAPQALVLCPTRELCVQITRDMEAFAACSPAISMVAVYGGTPIPPQLAALARGVQIIVATPGRLLDILRRKRADLRGVERVILDEADEMLSMGFQEDLEAILAEVPDTAHTLLFSATMPQRVSSISRNYMKDPEEITIGQRNAGAENVTHECYVVHQCDRYRALKRIADIYPGMYAIVFCRTRQDTQGIADWLIRDGYNVDALHGDLTQAQRDRVMEKFRSKALQILVATDVAARGLDVNDLTHVINYNLPDDLGSYTHRSGRTGRAGKSGTSVVIINMREKGKVRSIEHMIKTTFVHREVPTGVDVCRAQLLRLVERMKSVEIPKGQLDPFLPDIHAAVAGMSPEEIATRFVALQFGQLLDYYRKAEDLSTTPPPRPARQEARGREDRGRPARKEPRGREDRPPRPRPAPPQASPRPSGPPGVRLSINLGKEDGFNPKKLTGLIAHSGATNGPVARIEIMKKSAFFDVAAQDVEAVRRTLGTAGYKGRDVRITTVGEAKSEKRYKTPKYREMVHKHGLGKSGGPGGKGGKRPAPHRTRPATGA
ncbi:MAG: DEAD/DEAH box helicase [Lentisphaerae bacterium]|nr:DEAD/DEAH box helicase [Lentisphaerota bacterium]